MGNVKAYLPGNLAAQYAKLLPEHIFDISTVYVTSVFMNMKMNKLGNKCVVYVTCCFSMC